MSFTVWNFKIGDVAFKQVVPLTMVLSEQHKKVVVGRKFLFFKEYESKPTGAWAIRFEYNRGPLTTTEFKIITFDTESEARAWYDSTFSSLFLNQTNAPAPLPPKRPKKKADLRLL